MKWTPDSLREIKNKTPQNEELTYRRLRKFKEMQEGRLLLKELKISHLKLNLDLKNPEVLLAEAESMIGQFVPHRSSESLGWKSLCLHGLGDEMTMAHHDYGYESDAAAPYDWTPAAKSCPHLKLWLQDLLAKGFYKKFHRVRLMLLEPGGYIDFHRDRPEEKRQLGPVNIALNMPEGCEWLFEQYGSVPFQSGDCIAVDISQKHAVFNFSNQNRYHLIIHGEYGPAFFDEVVAAAQRRYEELERFKAWQRSNVGYGLWCLPEPGANWKRESILLNVSRHFARIKSKRPLHILEDYSLTRLIERSRNVNWLVIYLPGTVFKNSYFPAVEKHLYQIRSTTQIVRLTESSWAIPMGTRYKTGAEIQSLIDGNTPPLFQEGEISHYLSQNDNLSQAIQADGEGKSPAMRFLVEESACSGNILFPFNTESYLEIEKSKDPKPLDGLISVASGFKDLYIAKAHGVADDFELHYIDLNPVALDFKKSLFTEWDGQNYPEFLDYFSKRFSYLNWGAERAQFQRLWEQELDHFGGHDAFLKIFRKIKEKKVTYRSVDLIEDPHYPSRWIKERDGKNYAVWYSNCFNYTPTLAAHDWNLDLITHSGLALLSSLSNVQNLLNRSVWLYGDDILLGSKCFSVRNVAAEVFL